MEYIQVKRPIDKLLNFQAPDGFILRDILERNRKPIEELGRVNSTEMEMVRLVSDDNFFNRLWFYFLDNVLIDCTGDQTSGELYLQAMSVYPAENLKITLDELRASNHDKFRGELVNAALDLGLYKKWEIFEMLL